MNRHMMIDLETLSTQPNAVVSAIGAVIFDIDTGEIINKFYRALSFESQLRRGRKIDESTLKWWFSQDKKASEIYLTEDKVETSTALSELYLFMIRNSNPSDLKVWGNGPSFDLTILETLMKDYDITPPYDFRNIRCLRTFKEFTMKGKKVERVGIHHNALDDCLYQINMVLSGLGVSNEN